MEIKDNIKNKKNSYQIYASYTIILQLILYSIMIFKNPTELYLIKTGLFYLTTIILLLLFILKEKNKRIYINKFKNLKLLVSSSLLIFISLILTTTFNDFNEFTLIGMIPNLGSITFYIFTILFIFLVSPIFDKLNYKLIFKITILSITLFAILINIQYFYTDIFYNLNQFERIRIFAGLGNRNYAVMPFSLAFIISTFELLNQKSKKLIHYIIIAISFNIILLSLTRGVWLALFISLLLTFIYILRYNNKFFQREKYTIFKILLIMVIVFIVINIFDEWYILNRILTMLGISGGLNYEEINSISTNRLFIWTEGIKLLNSPTVFWLGINPSNQIAYEVTGHANNFHNHYIESFVTLGIFGFTGFLLFIYSLVYYSFKLTKYNIKNIGMLCVTLFLSFKWLFNSINSLNFFYALLIITFIIGKYITLNDQMLTQSSK